MSVPGAAEVNVLVPFSAVTMSWPVLAVRLIDVEATNLTVVVLFAAARPFSQMLAVVPSSRKTSLPTSTAELLSGADVNNTEPSAGHYLDRLTFALIQIKPDRKLRG